MRKWIHGEVLGFETSQIPQGAKKIEVKDDFFVVGQSETHGNDHRVAVLDKKQVEFYEKDGVLYMKNLTETNVYCPNNNRHDTQIIPASVWEIKKSQEWDYLEMQKREVRD